MVWNVGSISLLISLSGTLAVMGMGNVDGVAIAQAIREGILKQGNCRKEPEVMCLSEAFPSAHLREGAYVDDRLCTFQLPKKRLLCTPGHYPKCQHCQRDGGQQKDVVNNQICERAYEVAGAPRSLDK
eukprot:12838553-Heterocapsa_arctica.AAC.1